MCVYVAVKQPRAFSKIRNFQEEYISAKDLVEKIENKSGINRLELVNGPEQNALAERQ